MDRVTALETDRGSLATLVTAPDTILSSLLSDSTGRPSQRGATWLQSMTMTMNSGFGAGAPRNDGYKGVREGREKGGFLPRIRGVGRTGKGPAPVPVLMLRALGVKEQEEKEANDKKEAKHRLQTLQSTIRSLEDNVVAACQSADDLNLEASEIGNLSIIRKRLDVLHIEMEREDGLLQDHPYTKWRGYEAYTQIAANILLDLEDFRARVPGLRETPRIDNWVSRKPIYHSNGSLGSSNFYDDITCDLDVILLKQPEQEAEINIARHENVEENVLGLWQELKTLSTLIVPYGNRPPYPDEIKKRMDALYSTDGTSSMTRYSSINVWLFTSPVWQITKLHRNSRPSLDITTTYIYLLLDIEGMFSKVFARENRWGYSHLAAKILQ